MPSREGGRDLAAERVPHDVRPVEPMAGERAREVVGQHVVARRNVLGGGRPVTAQVIGDAAHAGQLHDQVPPRPPVKRRAVDQPRRDRGDGSS